MNSAIAIRNSALLILPQLELRDLPAVHFVRFTLPEPARRVFAREPVALVVEHPSSRARTELSDEARAALLEDLGAA